MSNFVEFIKGFQCDVIVRLEVQRSSECLLCLLNSLQTIQRCPQANLRIDVLRVKLNGRLKMRHCLLKTTHIR